MVKMFDRAQIELIESTLINPVDNFSFPFQAILIFTGTNC